MGVSSYKDLLVWQKGMHLTKEVYLLTGKFPKNELYGIISQMQRAVISIPANIAEGHSRDSTKEYMRFLSIARGSLAELETFLTLSIQLQYCEEKDLEAIFNQCNDISRMLSGLKNKLKAKTKRF